MLFGFENLKFCETKYRLLVLQVLKGDKTKGDCKDSKQTTYNEKNDHENRYTSWRSQIMPRNR